MNEAGETQEERDAMRAERDAQIEQNSTDEGYTETNQTQESVSGNEGTPQVPADEPGIDPNRDQDAATRSEEPIGTSGNPDDVPDENRDERTTTSTTTTSKKAK